MVAGLCGDWVAEVAWCAGAYAGNECAELCVRASMSRVNGKEVEDMLVASTAPMKQSDGGVVMLKKLMAAASKIREQVR